VYINDIVKIGEKNQHFVDRLYISELSSVSLKLHYFIQEPFTMHRDSATKIYMLERIRQ